MKTMISWLTMKRQYCLFVDSVSGEEVYLYTDKYGQEFMANYNPYFFRVKRDE